MHIDDFGLSDTRPDTRTTRALYVAAALGARELQGETQKWKPSLGVVVRARRYIPSQPISVPEGDFGMIDCVGYGVFVSWVRCGVLTRVLPEHLEIIIDPVVARSVVSMLIRLERVGSGRETDQWHDIPKLPRDEWLEILKPGADPALKKIGSDALRGYGFMPTAYMQLSHVERTDLIMSKQGLRK